MTTATTHLTDAERRLIRFALGIAIRDELEFIDAHTKFGKVPFSFRPLVRKTQTTVKRMEKLCAKLQRQAAKP